MNYCKLLWDLNSLNQGLDSTQEFVEKEYGKSTKVIDAIDYLNSVNGKVTFYARILVFEEKELFAIINRANIILVPFGSILKYEYAEEATADGPMNTIYLNTSNMSDPLLEMNFGETSNAAKEMCAILDIIMSKKESFKQGKVTVEEICVEDMLEKLNPNGGGTINEIAGMGSGCCVTLFILISITASLLFI